MAEFAAKIKTNILVRNIRRKTMLGQPSVQEVNGRSLTVEGLPIQGTTEVVNNQAVTSLTMKTLETPNAIAVRR
jgi:hypothetical protein